MPGLSNVRAVLFEFVIVPGAAGLNEDGRFLDTEVVRGSSPHPRRAAFRKPPALLPSFRLA